jgi:hypothetical protein
MNNQELIEMFETMDFTLTEEEQKELDNNTKDAKKKLRLYTILTRNTRALFFLSFLPTIFTLNFLFLFIPLGLYILESKLNSKRRYYNDLYESLIEDLEEFRERMISFIQNGLFDDDEQVIVDKLNNNNENIKDTFY